MRLLRQGFGLLRNDEIAFLAVLGSILKDLPILLLDMPNKCNSAAFWANFWYKYGWFTGRILIWAWISAVVRIGCDRVHQLNINKNKGLANLATPYLRPQTVPR